MNDAPIANQAHLRVTGDRTQYGVRAPGQSAVWTVDLDGRPLTTLASARGMVEVTGGAVVIRKVLTTDWEEISERRGPGE